MVKVQTVEENAATPYLMLIIKIRGLDDDCSGLAGGFLIVPSILTAG